MTDPLEPLEGIVYVEAPLLPAVSSEPITPPAIVDARGEPILVVPVPGPPGRPGTSGAGIIHTEENPSTVWTITHNLNRAGPVAVVVTSLDYETTWDNVLVQRMSADAVRLTFDDPTSGHALIL